MMPTVMYPVPGGVSQSRSLKMIMATNSAIVYMAPNAVVPTAQLPATTAIMLRPYRFVGTQVRQQPISAAEGYLDTSAAPRPPPTAASFGDFGRRERALLGGGAKKLARSTVVELAVIRYGRAAV